MQVKVSTNVVKIEICLTVGWNTFSTVRQRTGQISYLVIIDETLEVMTNDLEEVEEPELNQPGFRQAVN